MEIRGLHTKENIFAAVSC